MLAREPGTHPHAEGKEEIAPHPDHPDWFEVHFHRKALEEWGIAYPEAPPGDELVLWMKVQPCSVCGGENEGELGAIDPEYVTEEGLLVGKQICEPCLKAGE